jgi:hypothetical protein
MFLEFVFFQILSLCIFCIFGQGFSDVQIDVYKVSKETKLKKLSNTFCLRSQKLNVHITVKYLTVVPPVIMKQWKSVVLLPPIVTTLTEHSHFRGGSYCIRACKLVLFIFLLYYFGACVICRAMVRIKTTWKNINYTCTSINFCQT